LKKAKAQEPAPAISSDIKNRIKGKVAVVGVGNILRGDDGLGPRLIGLLKTSGVKASLFDCGAAPENYIFSILSSSSDTIILIDAADFGMPAGTIKIFNANEISGVSLSTHNLSPRLCIDLLKTAQDNLNIFIVSIQPKANGLGDSMSEEVMSSLDILKSIFLEILNGRK